MGQEQRRTGDGDHAADPAADRRAAQHGGCDGRQKVGGANIEGRVADEGRKQDSRDAVEQPRGGVGSHPVAVHADAADPGGDGVGTDGDEASPVQGEAQQERGGEHERHRHPHREVDREDTRLAPVGEDRRHPRLLGNPFPVPDRRAHHDGPDSERDDQGIQPEVGDQNAVDHADTGRDRQCHDDRLAERGVLTAGDAQDQAAGERDDGGDREVDAARHEDQGLAHRRDAEEGRERDDGEDRGGHQAPRHEDGADDDEHEKR